MAVLLGHNGGRAAQEGREDARQAVKHIFGSWMYDWLDARLPKEEAKHIYEQYRQGECDPRAERRFAALIVNADRKAERRTQ